MMTSEERVAVLHEKMAAFRKKKEKRITCALGAASTALALCLTLLVFGGGQTHFGGTAGTFSGAMMLFGNAGAYVLVAIAAFMAGVIITVWLKKAWIIKSGQ